jgi:hypothetical protein
MTDLQPPSHRECAHPAGRWRLQAVTETYWDPSVREYRTRTVRRYIWWCTTCRGLDPIVGRDEVIGRDEEG